MVTPRRMFLHKLTHYAAAAGELDGRILRVNIYVLCVCVCTWGALPTVV